MKDLISRQAAIDELLQLAQDRYSWQKDASEQVSGINAAICAIEDLPSAQPDIIRCKDCRWGREACGNIECVADSNIPPEYHGYEWFCPNVERRQE